jgi:hypothetical protein
MGLAVGEWLGVDPGLAEVEVAKKRLAGLKGGMIFNSEGNGVGPG